MYCLEFILCNRLYFCLTRDFHGNLFLQIVGKVSVKQGLMRLIPVSVSPFLPLLIFPVGNLTLYCKVPLFQLHEQTAFNWFC